jgi:UPF0716 family protein affecting phage T7 exclusion
MTNLFNSYETLALGLAALIFLITVILLVARLIGFWVALLLLLFSLATGMLVGNYTAFREYLSCNKKKEIEEHQTLKEKVDHLSREVDQLKEQLDALKNPHEEIKPSN